MTSYIEEALEKLKSSSGNYVAEGYDSWDDDVGESKYDYDLSSETIADGLEKEQNKRKREINYDVGGKMTEKKGDYEKLTRLVSRNFPGCKVRLKHLSVKTFGEEHKLTLTFEFNKKFGELIYKWWQATNNKYSIEKSIVNKAETLRFSIFDGAEIAPEAGELTIGLNFWDIDPTAIERTYERSIEDHFNSKVSRLYDWEKYVFNLLINELNIFRVHIKTY